MERRAEKNNPYLETLAFKFYLLISYFWGVAYNFKLINQILRTRNLLLNSF